MLLNPRRVHRGDALPGPREGHLAAQAARGPELAIKSGTRFNLAALLAAPWVLQLRSLLVTRMSEYSRSLFLKKIFFKKISFNPFLSFPERQTEGSVNSSPL